MYEIDNDYSIYIYINKNTIVEAKSEEELIAFLARFVKDLTACGEGFFNPALECTAWDSYGRNINLYDYKEDVLDYYFAGGTGSNADLGWRLPQSKPTKFRKEPVPYTGKNVYHWFSKKYDRHSKVGRLVKIYKNPEYKNFNRPMKNRYFKELRKPQRNWKSQRRHQYKNEQVL